MLALYPGSRGINGIPIVFAPEEFAAVSHLGSLVGQKYEAITVHTDLNVSGA